MKIDREQAHSIRLMYHSGLFTQKQLAERFLISQPLVSKIVNKSVHKIDSDIMLGGTAKIQMGYIHGN